MRFQGKNQQTDKKNCKECIFGKCTFRLQFFDTKINFSWLRKYAKLQKSSFQYVALVKFKDFELVFSSSFFMFFVKFQNGKSVSNRFYTKRVIELLFSFI